MNKKKIVWCVYWFDKNRNCYNVEIENTNGVDNFSQALKVGIDKLKSQGCKIKKDYEVDIKILSVDNEIIEHIADF
jgi:hypothetical protein